MHRPICTCIALLAMFSAGFAADDASPMSFVPVVPGAVVQAPAVSPWTIAGRLGAYAANVSTNNAESSRDTTIATTAESTSYLFTY